MKEIDTNIRQSNDISNGDELLDALKSKAEDSVLDMREELCRRCGLCCCEKCLISGIIFIDRNKPCQYLNNNGCSIYEERRTKNKDGCTDIVLLLKNKALPRTCAYVQANWRQIKSWYVSPMFGEIKQK